MEIKYWIYKIWYSLTLKLRKARISISSARLSGGGSLIDIRYWLSRPDKLQRNGTVYLLDETTKEKLYPANFVKFGIIRTIHGKKTTNGVALFFNRNKIIKAGSKVILVYDSLISEKTEVL